MTTRRMFGLGALSAGLLISGPAFAKATVKATPQFLSIDARSPFASCEGRTADMLDTAGAPFVRASFPVVVLRLNFIAAKLTLRTLATSENVYIDVSVDGGEAKVVRLASGRQDLTLFEGPMGKHSIEVTRRTESWEGQWDILGATIDQGQFLPSS